MSGPRPLTFTYEGVASLCNDTSLRFATALDAYCRVTAADYCTTRWLDTNRCGSVHNRMSSFG
jgi:hypothetical protein